MVGVREADMADDDIAYIRTEPISQSSPCMHIDRPNFRCTIELTDGSTIMRCGATVEHALTNAMATKQWLRQKTSCQSLRKQ